LPNNIKKLFSLAKEENTVEFPDTFNINDLDEKDANGVSLLEWIKKINNQTLLNDIYQVAINSVNIRILSPLFLAIHLHQSKEIIEKLINESNNIDPKLIHLACGEGQIDAVK